MTTLSDDEFVGYTFTGAPERRPLLWFLDRHIRPLINVSDRAVTRDNETGIWHADWQPHPDITIIPVVHLRYQHLGAQPWTAVWRLTFTTIPHVHTFGRDDDVWRLGIWPD